MAKPNQYFNDTFTIKSEFEKLSKEPFFQAYLEFIAQEHKNDLTKNEIVDNNKPSHENLD